MSDEKGNTMSDVIGDAIGAQDEPDVEGHSFREDAIGDVVGDAIGAQDDEPDVEGHSFGGSTIEDVVGDVANDAIG
jgi:hypothetical protein